MADRTSTGDRVQGSADELKGKAKQAWGDLTDDDRLKAEGRADEAKGKAERFMGDVKDKLGDKKDDVGNAVEDVRDDIERRTR
jgi:uncharacterized protein YjbJ (UPF0337 family)